MAIPSWHYLAPNGSTIQCCGGSVPHISTLWAQGSPPTFLFFPPVNDTNYCFVWIKMFKLCKEFSRNKMFSTYFIQKIFPFYILKYKSKWRLRRIAILYARNSFFHVTGFRKVCKNKLTFYTTSCHSWLY